MDDVKERRHLERISIPGAQTLYKVEKKFTLLNRYTGPTTLKDITKHGACIEIRDDLSPGSRLSLEIIVPGEEKISVRGQIVWANQDQSRGSGFAGVQFWPYGEGKRYNSFKTRETLERLTRHYQEID